PRPPARRTSTAPSSGRKTIVDRSINQYPATALDLRYPISDIRCAWVAATSSKSLGQILLIGYRLSVIGYRLSAIGYRLSVIGYRLSAIGHGSPQQIPPQD